MKNYTVKINTNTKKFQPKDVQIVGTVKAKNKAEAIDAVYAAFYGKDNDAFIYPEMSEYVGPKSKSRMVAEID